MGFDLFLKTNFQDSKDYTSLIADFAMTPYRSLFGGFEVTYLNLDSRVNFKEITPYHRQWVGAKKYILTAIAIILLVPATIAGVMIKGFQYATSPLVAEKYRSFFISKFLQRFKHPYDLKFLLNVKDPKIHQLLERYLSEEQLHIFVDHFLSENPSSIPKNIFLILPNRIEIIYYFFLSLIPEQLEGLPPYNEIPPHFLQHFFSLLNCDKPQSNKINLSVAGESITIIAKKMISSFNDGPPEFRNTFKELIKSIHPSNIPPLLDAFSKLFTSEKIKPLRQEDLRLNPVGFFKYWYPVRTNENLADEKKINFYLSFHIDDKSEIKGYLLKALVEYCRVIEPFFCYKPFLSHLLETWPFDALWLEKIFSLVFHMPSLSDLCGKVVQDHYIGDSESLIEEITPQIQRFKHPHGLKLLLNFKDPKIHQFLEQNLSEEQFRIFVDHFLSENPSSIPRNIFRILPNRIDIIHYFFLSLTPEQLKRLPSYNRIPPHFLQHFFSLLNCGRPQSNKINLRFVKRESILIVAKNMISSFSDGSPEFRNTFKDLVKSIHPSNIPPLLDVFSKLFISEKIRPLLAQDPELQLNKSILRLSPVDFFYFWYPIRTNENLSDEEEINSYLSLSIKDYEPVLDCLTRPYGLRYCEPIFCSKKNIKSYLLNALIHYSQVMEPFFCYRPFYSHLFNAWPSKAQLLEKNFSLVSQTPSLSDLCRRVIQDQSNPLKDEDKSNLDFLCGNSILGLLDNYDYRSKFSLTLKKKTLSILKKINHCLDGQGDLESLTEEIAQQIIKDREDGALLTWWFSQQDYFKDLKRYCRFIRSVIGRFSSKQFNNLSELYQRNSCIPAFDAAIFPFLSSEFRNTCFNFLLWNRTIEYDIFVDGENAYCSPRSICRIDVTGNEIYELKRASKECSTPVNIGFFSFFILLFLGSSETFYFDFNKEFIYYSIRNYSTREWFILINYLAEKNIDINQDHNFAKLQLRFYPIVDGEIKGIIRLFKEFDPKSYPYFVSAIWPHLLFGILKRAIKDDATENKLIIKTILEVYMNNNSFLDQFFYTNVFSLALKNTPESIPIDLIRRYFSFLEKTVDTKKLINKFFKINNLEILKKSLDDPSLIKDKEIIVKYLNPPFAMGLSIFGEYQAHKLSEFDPLFIAEIFNPSSFEKWKIEKIDENLTGKAEMRAYSKIIPRWADMNKRYRPIFLHFFKKYCIIMDACT